MKRTLLVLPVVVLLAALGGGYFAWAQSCGGPNQYHLCDTVDRCFAGLSGCVAQAGSCPDDSTYTKTIYHGWWYPRCRSTMDPDDYCTSYLDVCEWKYRWNGFQGGPNCDIKVCTEDDKQCVCGEYEPEEKLY